MAAPNDNNRALERSKVDLDPLSALLSAPPSAPASPPDMEVLTPAPAPAPALAPVAAPVADATPRRSSQPEPSFPYPPSSTPRSTSTTAHAPSPPQPQPQPPQRGSPPLVPHKPPGRPQPQTLANPFLATSARGAVAGVGSGGGGGGPGGSNGGGGAGDAMRQVGDVLNNLGSLLSSGLDSLSISLGGNTTNNPNGPSPPPLPPPHHAQAQSPHAHTGHPLGSPSFATAALASSPSPTPMTTAQRGAGTAENAVEDPAAGFPLLSGEQRLASLPNFLLQTVHGVAVPGQLLITTYQVAFLPSPSRPLPPQLAHLPPSFFRLPMAAIDRTEREVRASGQGTSPPSVALVLHTKDGRVLRLLPAEPATTSASSSSLSTSPTAPPPPQSPSSLNQQQQQEVGLERVKGLVDAYAFPNDREGPAARHLFCFAHHKALLAQGSTLAAPPHPDHKPALLEAEYARQFRRPNGVWLDSEGCPWRLSAANAGHRLCASYPATLVVPRLASDEELAASAAFRSEQRLPALTWGASAHGGSLWRSSQPRVGMAGASSPEDERVLRLIGAGLLGVGQQGNGRPPQQPGAGILRIMDLRNKTAAMANRATGHGYESSANYPTSVLTFCNIGNIHAMREAGQRLTQLCQSLAVQDAEWGALVEGTKWLTHLRLVLNAAYRAAHAVAREEASVLLHCSHGWDRTSQVAALAQLILDPYYRTFDGFAVLVEKDFGAFGHPFQLRTAHGLDRNARNEEQLAPIFLQFLDGVHQLLAQHPALFEFSGRLLLALADHLHDCRFGSFLCNTPKERAGPPVCTPAGSAASASMWTYLAHPAVRARLRNPLYLAPANTSTNTNKHAHPQRILDTPLPALLRRVALWGDYWLRWAAKPCHPPEAYAGVRRAREAEAAARAGKGENADVAVAWAWLEEEEEAAERALLLSSVGALQGQQGEEEQEQETDLVDLASVPAPPMVAAAKPEAVAAGVGAAPRQEASEVVAGAQEGDGEDDGFVDLVDSAGVSGSDGGEAAEEEGAEIASEFM